MKFLKNPIFRQELLTTLFASSLFTYVWAFLFILYIPENSQYDAMWIENWWPMKLGIATALPGLVAIKYPKWDMIYLRLLQLLAFAMIGGFIFWFWRKYQELL